MKTLRPVKLGYADAIDALYLSFSGDAQGYVGSEDEVGQWMTVQYSWPDNRLMGMEIYGLKEHFGEPPMRLTVAAREPFVVEIPKIEESVPA